MTIFPVSGIFVFIMQKMFSPERLALVFLAAALMAFAVVMLVSKQSDAKTESHHLTADTLTHRVDTAAFDTASVSPQKRRRSRKSKQATTPPPPQRDHLHEIVAEP